MKNCYCLSRYRNGKNPISAQRIPGLALEILQVTVIKPFTPQPLVLCFCVPMAECRRTFESLPCEIYIARKECYFIFWISHCLDLVVRIFYNDEPFIDKHYKTYVNLILFLLA